MDLNFFKKQGYLKFKIEDFELIDLINFQLQDYWDNLIVPSGAPNREYQQKWLDDGNLRLQDIWSIFNDVHKLAVLPEIISLLESLYCARPKPFQTINFLSGTEQDIHSDAVHFNSEPFRKMCGVWIALEDISDDQGPLFYYPGSQNLPELDSSTLGFEITTSNYSSIVDYWNSTIQEEKFCKTTGILEKGEGIIWDGNLLHGGSVHMNRSKTRKSMVTHFYFEGSKPWRPLNSSENNREYFEPNYIPLTINE